MTDINPYGTRAHQAVEAYKQNRNEREHHMSNVQYPTVTVQLTGNDGNAFAVLGAVSKAMRQSGIDRAAIDTYMKDAMSGDYDHLLQTTMRTVNVS